MKQFAKDWSERHSVDAASKFMVLRVSMTLGLKAMMRHATLRPLGCTPPEVSPMMSEIMRQCPKRNCCCGDQGMSSFELPRNHCRSSPRVHFGHRNEHQYTEYTFRFTSTLHLHAEDSLVLAETTWTTMIPLRELVCWAPGRCIRWHAGSTASD